ncbi:MAG: DUF1592 domain-containing protein [Candidatus Neomarinimicrobiota bacterium]
MKIVPSIPIIIFILIGSFSATNLLFSKTDNVLKSVKLIEDSCHRCHGGDWATEAGVDFTGLKNEISIWEKRKTYTRALDMLNRNEMPPPDEPQLSKLERANLINWLSHTLDNVEIDRIPKDPGFISPRRFNKYQYNYTVMDLFGIDEVPDGLFPSDLRTEDSFDNNMETLTTEPLWFERSLKASKEIVNLVWSNPEALKQLFIMRPTPPIFEEKAHYVSTIEEALKLNMGDGNFSVLALVKGGEGNILIKSPPLEGFTRGSIQLSYDKESITYQIGSNSRIEAINLSISDSTKSYVIALNVQENRSSLFLDGRLLASVANYKNNDIDENLFKVGKAARYKSNNIIDNDESIKEEEKYKLPPVKDLWFFSNPLSEEVIVNYSINPKAEKLPEPSFHWYVGKKSPKPKVITVREASTNILDNFLLKAFRRPPTEDEINRYYELFLKSYNNNIPFDLAMRVPVIAALSSPSFLMLSEEAMTGETIYPVSSIDMASRLSYFLWSSGPDQELISAGISGQLLDPDEILRQTNRMLADEKANRFFERFVLQWLRTEGLGDTYMPDQSLFPEINESLLAAMKEEGIIVVRNVMRENKSLLRLLDDNSTFMNADLAKHYGYEKQITGTDWQEVVLKDSHRGGLLTQAAVLTVSSSPNRTSPVFRGKWVLDVLLGEPPPPPPPNVGTLDSDDETSNSSLRELLESHRSKAECASCHNKIDPYGFALEQYDPIGRLKKRDQNTSTTLWNGLAIDGAADLREFLLNEKSTTFIRHLTEKILSYALSRDLIFSDERSVFTIINKLEGNNFEARMLIDEIVLSEPFRYRKES